MYYAAYLARCATRYDEVTPGSGFGLLSIAVQVLPRSMEVASPEKVPVRPVNIPEIFASEAS